MGTTRVEETMERGVKSDQDILSLLTNYYKRSRTNMISITKEEGEEEKKGAFMR